MHGFEVAGGEVTLPPTIPRQSMPTSGARTAFHSIRPTQTNTTIAITIGADVPETVAV